MSASFDPKFIHFSVAAVSSSLLTGLMGYWKLDETSGNAADASGNSRTGTSSNITYTASGKISRCYTFNGTSSKVTISSSPKPTTGFSVSFWAKDSTAANGPAVTLWDYATGFEGYNITIYNDGAIGFMLGDNTAGVLDSSYKPFTVLDGNWHHIVCTWNGSAVYIYIDGTNKSTNLGPWTSTIVYGTSSTAIGFDSRNSAYYTGDIDEIGVWSRALTDTEVTTLYNSGAGKTYNFS